MSVWIAIVGVAITVGCLFVLALCRAAGNSDREMTRIDAMRLLLERVE